jgi:hypothetical protein
MKMGFHPAQLFPEGPLVPKAQPLSIRSAGNSSVNLSPAMGRLLILGKGRHTLFIPSCLSVALAAEPCEDEA